MPRKAFTPDETALLRDVVDGEILRRSRGPSNANSDAADSIINSLAPLFAVREKLKPAAQKQQGVPRSSRCAVKLSPRRRCELRAGHDGTHVHDGYTFNKGDAPPQAGWKSDAEAGAQA